jgi:hypothetical protein
MYKHHHKPLLVILAISLLCACTTLTGIEKDINDKLSNTGGAKTPPQEETQKYPTIKDTPLNNVFMGHETSEFPRVAINVIFVPTWGASLSERPYTSKEYPKDRGCFELSARLWTNMNSHQDIKPFFLCPQDVVTGVGFVGLTTVSPGAGDKNTGSVATLGPVPPFSIWPTDPDTQKLFDGFPETMLNGQLYMLGSLMVDMHYDWNSALHNRVWIAQYVQAHSTYFREK